MIKIYDYSKTSWDKIFPRDLEAETNVEATVAEIIKEVREQGDVALFRYTEKFDGVKLASLKVSQAEIDAAYANTDRFFIETMEMAAANIREFHKHQLRNDFLVNKQQGVVLGQKYIPVAKAGLYVPGGTAAYASSVLMNAIPAKIAGVQELVMVTPPDKDGKINESILAAAKVAGIDGIYKVGGAQAIAALAYGTESIPQVDKIVGPGNIYVATAKRQVYGQVGIDMIAGPSEILIIADGTCDPAHVAADLLSQAEHDELAVAVLVTDSYELAKGVQKELERQTPLLSRSQIAQKSLASKGRIIVTENLEEAVEISNRVAPEHLEIATEDPFGLLDSITNAGSVFLGKHVPEALGDYFAGPNHTLPTSGTARFSSPLSVDDFIKTTSFCYYTKNALGKVKDRIIDFAEREGLDAHAKSVAIRFRELEDNS